MAAKGITSMANMSLSVRAFVGVNAHIKSNAAPGTPPTLESAGGAAVNHYVARLSQVLCVRLTVRSKPHLVVFPTPYLGSPGPRPADCPWEWPQPSIDGDYVSGNRRFKAV